LLSTKELKNQIEYLFVYLLCFTYAFEKYGNLGYVTFYSNDLELSYIINKRLKLHKEKIEKSKDPNLILKVTWHQVINLLVEYKSSWSIENMYIISYQRLDNQTQKDVEYISIPKLQASVILDDTIRYNLNNKIQFRSKNFDNNECWLLEEFIKGRPLYPIILNHINLVLNENEKTYLRWSPSLYSLITDAKILELRRKNKGKSLFSNDFFDTYKSLTNEIKKDVRYTSFSTSLISQISKDTNKKRRIARELFGALKEGNKNIFLNILLKYMNEEKGICSNKNLNSWVFERIIKNDINYKMYGLVLIMNLLKGG
jgi:CRISPR-associated protein Cst1